jgi:hypothetical protein
MSTTTIPTQAIYDKLAEYGLEPCKAETCPDFDLYGQTMLESKFIIGISESDVIVSCVLLGDLRYVHFALYLGRAWTAREHIRVELTPSQTYLSVIEDTADQIHTIINNYETKERFGK